MALTKLHWIAEITIGDGQLDTFKERAAGIIAAVEATEPGTLSYEWYITEDGKTCYVDEWYADSEAGLAHLDGEAPRMLPRLLEVGEFTSLTVLSEIPDATLKEKLSAFGSAFTSHSDGFTR